jgi:hypothetical protein
MENALYERHLMNALLDTYFVGSVPSLAMAYTFAKNKGVRGFSLLVGAIVVAASWPLWAVGAILLAAVGTLFAIAAAVALITFIVLCVIAFVWFSLLLKVMEIVGWFKD